ncbi:uncharacterized protein LOC105837874 isoform X2 [Monomorium pharaonis]|uniref:uncharacterized protein LOC105837874 isoform X2 n=1 Tax=Monomorium pharaonis TaxID=307658 RepID=UPI00102E0FE1|nr:uncharacterized protein LOC105837874 isoform X2 [Monomorium pharaonis]
MKESNMFINDNSRSIEHILYLISYISWFLGVGVARPRNCSKAMTTIIRIVYLAVYSINMVYGSMHLFNYVFILDNLIFGIVFFIAVIICYVSTYYYVYHGISQYDKWPELMNKIKKLDQKIRKETYINNQPVKNVEVVAILVTLVCCLLLLIVYIKQLSCTYLNHPIMSDLLYFCMLIQSLINSFVFDIVVYVLYYRFKTINKLIGQLNELSNASWIALKIKRIRELHYGICDLVVMVNDIYGVYLLLYSANCFTVVVASSFRIYVYVAKKHDINYYYIFTNIVILILHALQFCLTCWICTLVRQESDKTGIIICAIVLKCKPVDLNKLNRARHRLSIEMQPPLENLDNDQNCNWNSNCNLNYVILESFLRINLDRDCVRNEINDFLSQLQHRRVAFTACDFFEMSNALFCGVSTKFI